MSDQAREQVLSCLEDVKLDLEEIQQHTSAIVVGQAVEVINDLASRLDQVRLALANRESYGDQAVAISTIRHIVGEKWIAESNPGTPPDTRVVEKHTRETDA